MEALCIGCVKACKSYTGLRRHQKTCASFKVRKRELQDQGNHSTEFYEIQHDIQFSSTCLTNGHDKDRVLREEPWPGVQGIEDFQHDPADTMEQSFTDLADSIVGDDEPADDEPNDEPANENIGELLDGVVSDRNDNARFDALHKMSSQPDDSSGGVEDTVANHAEVARSTASSTAQESAYSTYLSIDEVENLETNAGHSRTLAECDDVTMESIWLPPVISSTEPWLPFDSEWDQFICSWFLRSSTSGNMTDDLLGGAGTAEFMSQITSAKNADDVYNRIENIPHGIPNDTWIRHTLQVDPLGKDRTPYTGTLLCRDIVSCIQFLVGYKPFKDGLSWAPVRHMQESASSDGSPPTSTRMFNEMHTGDWWWEAQKTFPSCSTVIPIMFASDKTQMSHLHGDVMGYPVYITIGNLSRKLRRMQTAPAVIMLGMIPVIKAHKDDYDRLLKAKLYHEAMRIMFEREYHCFA
jgi:hypothetical protein